MTTCKVCALAELLITEKREITNQIYIEIIGPALAKLAQEIELEEIELKRNDIVEAFCEGHRKAFDDGLLKLKASSTNT